MSLVVAGLVKSFGDVPALAGVDLEVHRGELLVVLGPSGSGKSTMLRCIAGLDEPDAGRIEVNGRDVTGAAPRDRDVAMVFQDFALYPHLDAASNIAFPLLARKMEKAEASERVRDAAEMLDISGVLSRKPSELSGGERRRVALARAVVRAPSAFLMDEPLASLDVALRRRVQMEMRDLQARTGITTLYVTHDQGEAMMLGRRLAVLRDGRVEQVGPPVELYERPVDRFVASFLGRAPMNLLPAALLGPTDGANEVGIRPERVRLVSPSGGRLVGRVTALDDLGAETLVEVEVGALLVLAQTVREAAPRPGDEVGLAFEPADVLRFDADGKAIY